VAAEHTPVRAVLDTNVLVSALVAESGAPHRILALWLEGRFVLVTSLLLAEELAFVLTYPRIAQRLRWTREEIAGLLAGLLATAEVTAGQLELPGVSRDPKDDAVVACAVEGGADVIVSGDRDLLELGGYQGIRMLTPRQFVELLDG